MSYIEIAMGKPSNRGTIIALSELSKRIQIANAINQSLYRSIFSFDEDIKKHFEIRKTCKNFQGKYYLDELTFDFDIHEKKDNIFLLEIKEFINKLENEWNIDRYEIKYYFSGRGFHLVTSNFFHFKPSVNLPQIVKATILKYFPNVDLAIYTSSALIKVNKTLNDKSKLFKIQLTYEEITELDLNEIREIAKIPRDINIKTELSDINHSDKIVLPKKVILDKKILSETTNNVTCRQNILNEGSNKGSRHVVLLRLISLSQRMGMTLNECKAIGKIWNTNGTDPLSDYELEKQIIYIYKQNYTLSCRDSILSMKNDNGFVFCDSKCIYFRKKNSNIDVNDSNVLEKRFVEFSRDILTKSINIGSILDVGRLEFIPTDYILMLAASGKGKTAFAQNIAVGLKSLNPNYTVLYFNLEFSLDLLYRRTLQIALSKTKKQIIDYYASNTNSLSKYIDHIKFVETPPKLDTLEKMIYQIKPTMVIIDTLGDIDENQGTDNTSTIGGRIKTIANNTKTIIFGIHHISKSATLDASGNEKELTMLSGLGSSKLYQKADYVLGLEGNTDTPFRKLVTLKARDDNSENMQLFFNKKNFRMIGIDR